MQSLPNTAKIITVETAPDDGPYPPFPPITLKVKDACHALGVRRTTLFHLLATGKLRRVKIGRCTLVTTDSMRKLVANSVDETAVR